MLSTKIISISMPEAQLKAAERLAETENRTMSELIREALRRYGQERRGELIGMYRKRAIDRAVTEADVVRIIRDFRRDEKQKRNSSRR